MDNPIPIPENKEIQPNLKVIEPNKPTFKIEMNLTIQDVRKQALLLYGTVAGFSRKLGITDGLGSRLLSGNYVPLKPTSIQKISDALNIDPIILTKIYEEIKYKRMQERK